MKRRKALQQIGAGLSGSLLFPGLATVMGSCKHTDPGPEIKYDGTVAIVGAGISGLYVADILKSKGINVKLYEASDRVGGRIRSIRLLDDTVLQTDFPVELGAEKIIGTDSAWQKMIDQLSIPTVDLSTATDNFIIDGQVKDAGALEGDPDFAAARNFSEGISSYGGADVTVEQAAQTAGVNARANAILNSWIGNKNGTSDNRLGIKGLSEALVVRKSNNREKILRSNLMQDVMASRFSAVVPGVELNTMITAIDYSGTKVKLTGKKNPGENGGEPFSAEADKVILTVPVSILKRGDVSFSPSLPSAKTAALNNIGMDAAIRFIIDFKQNFWGTSVGYIFGGTQAPEYFNAGFSRSEFTKTLSVTAYGAQAEALSALPPDTAMLHILAELDQVYNGKATANVRKEGDTLLYEMKDWSKEIYIRGGMSYLKPGGTTEDRTTLGQSISGVLFFAGEACDDQGEAGTLNGALLAAERVAGEVIDSIVKA